MSSIVRIVGAPIPGIRTPHDGRFVVSWDPHTAHGEIRITSAADWKQARLFADAQEVLAEYGTVSKVQRVRPDGGANRPLTALTIEVIGLQDFNA